MRHAQSDGSYQPGVLGSGTFDIVEPVDQPTAKDLPAALRKSERDYRRDTQASVQGSGYLARPGDTIASIVGSSDPQAIDNFMRANGMTSDVVQAGQNYFVPDSWQAYGDQGAAGQRALDVGNARLAAIGQQRAAESSSTTNRLEQVLGYSTQYPALEKEVGTLNVLVSRGYLAPQQAQEALLSSRRANAMLRSDFESGSGTGTDGPVPLPSVGDGRSPIQRYLETSEPLYSSPHGAANYGIVKVFGLPEEDARIAGALANATEVIGGALTGAGLPRQRLIEPFGFKKFNPAVDSFVNMGKQDRHLVGTPANSRQGGGYFLDASDAQDVLNAYHRGDATVLGYAKDGGHVIRFDGVTGFNNNRGAGYFDQPTNVFRIKGRSSVSVVPQKPN